MRERRTVKGSIRDCKALNDGFGTISHERENETSLLPKSNYKA